MKNNQLIGFTLAIALLPSSAMLYGSRSAIASEITVKTGNVEASTYRDGRIYVNTGNAEVEVPSHRTSYWNPFHSWRLPWQSKPNNNCYHSTYQKTTHVSESGSQVVQSHTSTRTCN
jgi:hypothetical protein